MNDAMRNQNPHTPRPKPRPQNRTRNRVVQIRVSSVTLGAMIATIVGSLWILQYLLVTVYGSYGIRTPLIDYVTGVEYGSAFEDASTLTVSFLRLILSFGVVWPIATGCTALIRRGISKLI